jgi:hypothetical protein
MLGRRFICPIVQATHRIILEIDGFFYQINHDWQEVLWYVSYRIRAVRPEIEKNKKGGNRKEKKHERIKVKTKVSVKKLGLTEYILWISLIFENTSYFLWGS